jgi:hypothetical protein
MRKLSSEHKQCVHYWVVDPPNGPTSKGQCKHCGMVAEFFNDLQGCLKKPDDNARIEKVE